MGPEGGGVGDGGGGSGEGERDLTTICLFDVDGTLSPSRKVASDEIKVRMRSLSFVAILLSFVAILPFPL